MIRRKRTMRTKLSSFLIASACVLGWTGACSSKVTAGDSESHFLAYCSPGSCTGGLECVCGVCTKPCTDDGACSALGNATCTTHDDCSTPKSCDVGCTSNADCD